MKIDFANLQYQYQLYKTEIDEAIQKVLNKSNYIMGEEIKILEKELAAFINCKFSVVCGSGTDALILALLSLDIKPGDEIITTPFTFIATAETIALLGVKPVFVDIDEETYNIDVRKIEEKITNKTKAIIAVSLYGQPCDLTELRTITDNYKLSLIIDGAQSFGATYKDKSEVHYCDIYTTSFFPAKPLGCYGDGGAVFTNDELLAQKISMLRVHGQEKRYYHKYIGINGRMDTIQAAVLLIKLKYYKKEIQLRNEVAKKYSDLLENIGEIEIPYIKNDRTSVWAQYSIKVRNGNRSELQSNLKELGIPTAIHYPMPLHLQECFRYLGYKRGDFPIAENISNCILSLPMNPFLTNEQIRFISYNIKNFFKNESNS